MGIIFAPVFCNSFAASSDFLNVQNEPHIAKPIVLFASSIFYTSSRSIFVIVSFMIIPAVTGATRPGNDNAHTT